MGFELNVEFVGLCLYVHDPESGRVAVLMPDARKRTADPVHVDGSEGAPHVGDLRFNLADLDPAFPPGSPGEPSFECVHLFDFQELSFGPGAPVRFALNVPEFEKIAPHPDSPERALLELRPGMFSAQPPRDLLMRTRLTGGTLEGLPNEFWRFDATLAPEPFETQFANFVTWTLPVEGDHLTVELRSFAGEVQTSLTLRPADGARVSLKVANLCDKNPLEWEDLGLRRVDGDDLDFKWIYRLLQPVAGTLAELLNGRDLPIPKPSVTRGQGVEDCLPGQVGGSVPPGP
jgi:hypothetical protein